VIGVRPTARNANGGGRARLARRARGCSPGASRLRDLLNALGTTMFRQLLWETASELDLTFAQSQVLFYVDQHPGCHMGDVAKAFGVTLPAVTHIVDRLAQKRFLARGADPADRRVCVLALTPAGQALVRELETLQLGALEHVLARLAPTDRQRIIAGLEALVAAADGAADLARNGRGSGALR
jgi:DNA-binding MarR family transcriptional regulator